MLLKSFISLVIIICCSWIGLIYANSYTERSKLLISMLSSMKMLETEIIYSATPLPEILAKVAKKSKKEVGEIFLYTYEILDKKDGHLFSEAWEKAVMIKTRHLSLKQDDIDILISIGNNLGISDTNDQIKHISLAMEAIKRSYESSLIGQENNVKLFRNLGILIGITIVIILI